MVPRSGLNAKQRGHWLAPLPSLFVAFWKLYLAWWRKRGVDVIEVRCARCVSGARRLSS
jgi:hypothetical protein